jgi:hypothetical protein
MDLGCGMDVWRIHGEYNGKVVLPSQPVDFDELTDTFKTASGSVYHIQNYDGDRNKFIDQIRSDIAKKSYEVH